MRETVNLNFEQKLFIKISGIQCIEVNILVCHTDNYAENKNDNSNLPKLMN